MERCVLLGIVCRVCEDSGKEATDNAIATFHEDAVFVRIHEPLVEEKEPDPCEQLPLTKAVSLIADRGPVDFLVAILEGVGDLKWYRQHLYR